jgi:hypothetical protein
VIRVVLSCAAVAACGRHGFEPADSRVGVVVDGTLVVDGGGGDVLPDTVMLGTAACAGIKSAMPTAPSGVYTIDPDGPGPAGTLAAYCDMITDGGGWTLILNYLHRGGTAPALDIRASTLPLLGSDTLGTDESATSTWGHAANVLVAQFAFAEVRFTCRSSAHSRLVDFSTGLPACVEYVRNGQFGCNALPSSHKPLPGHDGVLPAGMTHFTTTTSLDHVLTEQPFFRNVMPKADWTIASGGNWECDYQSQGNVRDTLHRVWLR